MKKDDAFGTFSLVCNACGEDWLFDINPLVVGRIINPTTKFNSSTRPETPISSAAMMTPLASAENAFTMIAAAKALSEHIQQPSCYACSGRGAMETFFETCSGRGSYTKCPDPSVHPGKQMCPTCTKCDRCGGTGIEPNPRSNISGALNPDEMSAAVWGAFARRRLMNRPKTHVRVLEALLKEINNLS